MTTEIDYLVRPDRHIFLSPHYDDIALSCGGTAALLSANGRTPEVALIFGDHPDPDHALSKFAAGMHKDWGLTADEVISARRAEERMASLTLGTCDRFLPFRDAIYRGDHYTSNAQLFGGIHSAEGEIASQIISELRLATDGFSKTRIYSPCAIGGHVDHIHGYRTGQLLLERGWDVWFYEDLPYGLRPDNAAERAGELTGDGLTPGPIVDVSGVWGRKIDAIMAYPSQLSTVFDQYVGVRGTRAGIDEAMTSYARAAGNGIASERFWSRGG